jgi:hypothetical protein
MKVFPIALTLLLAVAGSSVARAESPDMEITQALEGFYRAYETFRPPAGVPDAATRSRFAPFISSTLDKLLTDAANAQARYEKLTQGRFPPLIEGDPFTPNFDGATSYAVRQCSNDARGAHCDVSLSFANEKDKPRSWTDRVELVRTNDGWRVNDIVYGNNGDAGSSGSLSDTLKSAIDHGNEMKQ